MNISPLDVKIFEDESEDRFLILNQSKSNRFVYLSSQLYTENVAYYLDT